MSNLEKLQRKRNKEIKEWKRKRKGEDENIKQKKVKYEEISIFF